ncbi:MAG: porphobilinogen synthase, partial [Thermodesulfovibrionales bacterium]|nr:porphobilinogen synthase [Thermodesulfovibrionales bacterium]
MILPYFIVKGKGVKHPIKSMPGVNHFSVDNVLKDIPKAVGIKSILLFGVSKTKNETGSQAYKKNGVVQDATFIT